MFVIGLALFTLASAAAALAPSIDALIAARAVQGVGAAIVTPLTLTLLSEAVPARAAAALALGVWAGITGLGVALGPLVGGAVVEGISWHWIFWLNVPIGLALIPLAAAPPDRVLRPRRARSTCPASRSSAPACSASSSASSAATRSGGRSADRPRDARRRRRCCSPRSSPGSCAPPQPMLPMRFFRVARLHRDQRRLVRDVLRDVRLDLPARAVLPDRAGPRRRSRPGCARCRGPAMPMFVAPDRRPAVATGSARGR